MKKLFFCIFIYVHLCKLAYNQEDNLSVKIKADVYSLHLWRGFANGNSPSIQPYAELNVKNFNMGVWAAYAINGSYSEIDFYINYQLKNLKLSLFDYFLPVTNGKVNSFFDFKKQTTRHAFDFIAEYESDNFPFRFLFSTIFYGDDKHPLTGNNFYSSYVEIAYKLNALNKKTQFIAAITPYKSYYADNIDFVMAGIKISDQFKISEKFELPISVFLMINPYSEKIYFNMGITL
jgi:hypothetical protein